VNKGIPLNHCNSQCLSGELIYSYMNFCAWNLNRCRQISALLDIKAWHKKNEQSQIADQLVLLERLDVPKANQQQLMKELGTSRTMPHRHRLTSLGCIKMSSRTIYWQ
jgi:hypothetical protein